jgi:putative FmdB family regulatory protein
VKPSIIQGFGRFLQGIFMPIYAYRCGACGFAKDVLQKMSDAQLTQCPSCGKPDFKKQVTAAGFQLKGSGWYVTDFRGGSSGAAAPASAEAAKGDAKSDATPAAPAPSPAPASGGGSSD